jgi:hypothetical protein
MRDSDGAFAVPQLQNAPQGAADPYTLAVVSGNASTGVGNADLTTQPVFAVGETRPGAGDPREFPCWDQGGGANFGFTAYSAAGTLYATAGIDPRHFRIAAQPAGGTTAFSTIKVDALGKLWFLWISGSETGEGALVTWASSRDCDPRATFWAAHVRFSRTTGGLKVTDVSRVVDVDSPCGDYSGSSVGPDGRAYVAVTAPDCQRTPGTQPLSVYIQQGGPRL